MSGGVLLKSVVKNFANFTEKHLCRSLFLNKVAEFRPVDFAKFLRTSFFDGASPAVIYTEQITHIVSQLESLDAVVQRCSVKKVFLEISQNLQKNTRVRVFF